MRVRQVTVWGAPVIVFGWLALLHAAYDFVQRRVLGRYDW